MIYVPTPEKHCTWCGEWKPATWEYFYILRRKGKPELRATCKPCFNILNNQPPRNMTSIERFWSKVDKGSDPNGCWIWTARRNPAGYGDFRWYGKMVLAPRVAWELATGSPPGDLLVCHHCDNPSCVNPSHLFLGTDHDNAQDKIAKGRQWKKLTVEKVVELRRLHHANEMNRSQLAERFGVSYWTIRNILENKTWKHC